jgi:Ca2+-transporting ATPase
MIDDHVTVTRGKLGSTEIISVWELVVGDVLYVDAGQRVPADCLVLESSDFKVDEDIDEKFRIHSDIQ